MTRELFRIRTAKALDDIEFLFNDAFTTGIPSDASLIHDEIRTLITEDFTLVGVAREDDSFVGLVVAFLPVDGFNAFPSVFQFYSVGSSKMRNMMIDAVVDWVKENGYNKFLASNFTKRPDCLWKRLFRRAGKLEKVGSIFMFELKEE